MTAGPLRKGGTHVERAEHAARVAEVAEFTRRIAERTQYRFAVHGRTSSGSSRFISPARARVVGAPTPEGSGSWRFRAFFFAIIVFIIIIVVLAPT